MISVLTRLLKDLERRSLADSMDSVLIISLDDVALLNGVYPYKKEFAFCGAKSFY